MVADLLHKERRHGDRHKKWPKTS